MSMNLKLYSVVERSLNFRRYTYRAYINRKTRRLYKIKAGCRTWYSFGSARAHYTNSTTTVPNLWIRNHTSSFGSNNEKLEMYRQEAIALLGYLEKDVNRRIRRLRAKRRRR